MNEYELAMLNKMVSVFMKDDSDEGIQRIMDLVECIVNARIMAKTNQMSGDAR